MAENKKTIAKILVADDDPNSQTAIRMMLQKLVKISNFCFHIRFVSLGKKAVDTCMEWEPEIMLIDFQLPDISAIHVLRQLNHNHALGKLFVLLMTSNPSEEAALMALTNGAKDILYKPIRPIELSLKMSYILGEKQKELKMAEAYGQLESEKRIFSKFFSNDIMEKILTDSELVSGGGINTFASILFLDIRNSTKLAESMDPKKFAQFLNLLFEDFSSIIYKNYGSINKFLGDGILATFGCPVVYGNDAYNSVQAALQLQKAIADFNLVRPENITEEIKIGIGIASGKVFAGTIGSTERMEYTVLGDSCNVSSRLQSLSGTTNFTTIIDGTTKSELNDILLAERLDFSHVRGRIGELEIYGLIGIDEAVAAQRLESQAGLQNLEEIGEVEFF